MELWVKVDVEDECEPIYLPREIYDRAICASQIYLMLCVVHNNIPQYSRVISLDQCLIEQDEYNTIVTSYAQSDSLVARESCTEFFKSSAYYMFKQGSRLVAPFTYH